MERIVKETCLLMCFVEKEGTDISLNVEVNPEIKEIDSNSKEFLELFQECTTDILKVILSIPNIEEKTYAQMPLIAFYLEEHDDVNLFKLKLNNQVSKSLISDDDFIELCKKFKLENSIIKFGDGIFTLMGIGEDKENQVVIEVGGFLPTECIYELNIGYDKDEFRSDFIVNQALFNNIPLEELNEKLLNTDVYKAIEDVKATVCKFISENKEYFPPEGPCVLINSLMTVENDKKLIRVHINIATDNQECFDTLNTILNNEEFFQAFNYINATILTLE